jgi:hypothetical protein
MRARRRHLYAFLSAIVGALTFSPALAVPVVKTQAPCTSQNGPCVTFNNTDTIGVIRSIAFKAPSAGTAIVTFHGSMHCNSDGVVRVVDLASAIVTDTSTAVTPALPSGARHAAAFPPQGTWNENFNLASTVVSTFTGRGNRNFYFKLARQRQDDGTTCSIYNAVFTVEFLPAADALVITQSPCVKANGYCFSFNATEALVVINAMTWNAPAKGTAIATFHGTLYCANSGTTVQTVDIDSEIVTDVGATAYAANPGGLRAAAILVNGPSVKTSRSFNLASTRVIPVPKAGSYTYYFKFNRNMMGPDTACYLYNAVFTVRFTRANATPTVASQAPCTPVNASCGETDLGTVYRSIKIRPTRTGPAIVTFHGSLTCKSSDGQVPNQEIYTQIIPDKTGFIEPYFPGGLENFVFNDSQAEVSFNLASTLVLNLSANKPVVVYMRQGGSEGANHDIVCHLYNASLTVKLD